MNTLKYVFQNRQPELRQFVVKYGLKPAKNRLDLFTKVNAIVAKYKDDALRDIAKIHPDRDLILWSVGYKEQAVEPIAEQTSSAAGCGCSGADGDYSNYGGCGCGCGCGCGGGCGCGTKNNRNTKFSNAEGAISENVSNNLPLIVIGSLLLVGGLLFIGGRQ